MNTDLYNPRSFDSIPLELMPYLLEMLQQGIGYNGFGKEIAPKTMPNMDESKSTWNPLTRKYEYESSRWGTWNPLTREREQASSNSKAVESLSRLYEVIMSWQSLPQLFSRGPGVTKLKATKMKSKSKPKPHKHRKFGDEGDDEDGAWIPKGARTTGRRKWNPATRRSEYIPPPVY